MTNTFFYLYDPHPVVINRYNNMSTSRKIFYKIGKLVDKTKRFLQKPEVKISAILSYWGLETVVCAVAVASVASNTVIAATILLYIYGTYALFSALSALV